MVLSTSDRPDPEPSQPKVCAIESPQAYPDIEVKVSVGYRLDVEAYSRYGGHYFADLGNCVR